LIKHIVRQMDTINGCLLQMLWLSKHRESKNQGGNSTQESRNNQGWVGGCMGGDWEIRENLFSYLKSCLENLMRRTSAE
jgi:hypothetical protein